MKLDKLKIYIASHRSIDIDYTSKLGFFEPLGLGPNGANCGFDLNDSLFEDNVSGKNELLSELSGLYWIWKHSKAEYVGLMHYRRIFLGKNSVKTRLHFLKQMLNYSLGRNYFLTKFTKIGVKSVNLQKLEVYLHEKISSIDLFVPSRVTMKASVKENWLQNHPEEQLMELSKAVELLYPGDTEAWRKYLDSNTFFLLNMFIGSNKVFDKYMNDLWPIVELLYPVAETYSGYDKRFIGFAAERYFGFWILKNTGSLRIEELPFVEVV